MKIKNSPLIPINLWCFALTLAATLLASHLAQATPFASAISGTNSQGVVSFVLNEAGANVTVVYEDGTTNATYTGVGTFPAGPQSFSMTNAAAADSWHSSFQIFCFKVGTGSPTLISNNTFSNSVWNAPSGVAANKNPKNGSLFGRLYVASDTAGGTGDTTKSRGIYALNPDQTPVAFAANPSGSTFFGSINSNFKSPGRIRVAPDNSLLVADARGAGNPNRVYLFAPDLSSSTALLGPSSASGAGDLFGTPVMFGSVATGDAVLYVASAGVGAALDTNCIKGPLTGESSFNCVYRFNIGAGPLPWNKRPDYAYTVGLDGIAQLRPEVDVSPGPDGMVYASLGRANASNPNLQVLRKAYTTNGITGDYANFQIQMAALDRTNWVYTSGIYPPFNSAAASAGDDPFAGSRGSGANVGQYAGVRVSPDGQYVAEVDLANGVTIASLENGIPNEGTIFGIVNTSATGNARGMDWDAGNNIWVASSGQGLIRCYSLGLTTSCVTSNDWTGTNGIFAMFLPGTKASLAVINANGSQNYTNNPAGTAPGQNPGAPIPAVFRINLTTNDTTAIGAVTVSFVRGGTAAYWTHYTINTNETPNGVTIGTNSVTFPAGLMPGGGNWYVDVKIIPTAAPVSGPTTTFTVRLLSGAKHSAIAPNSGNFSILNTGPQLLTLSAPAPGTLAGMNRGIPNDQARFRITRTGDLNGPGNDSVNPILQRSYTITNINYYPPAQGPAYMAELGVDYLAGPQRFTGAAPTDGSPGIEIRPNDTVINAMIGNPVMHVNTSLARTNKTVIINLTNSVSGGTNLVSSENLSYTVATAAVTLTEYDNALGGEVVLWSNPLTNAADSANWTLVYANINLSDSNYNTGSPTLPTVLSNYDNSAMSMGRYTAAFGKSVNDPTGDDGITVPPSAVMAANGWTTALKVSVNKDPSWSGESAVNLYPQTGPAVGGSIPFKVFHGNYALRFDMFLSLYRYGIDNPTIGSYAREFAQCGINHRGTNANWRLDINPRDQGTGAYPINADGEWVAIGAASGSVTPADYDLFVSPPWALYNASGTPIGQPVPYNTTWFTNQAVSPSFAPYTNGYMTYPGATPLYTNFFANKGVPNDQISGNNAAGNTPQNGIIKSPPFSGINSLGGAPVNAWVDVSLEITRQTNMSLKLAQQQIFECNILSPLFGTANPLAPFDGTPMLGYLDPNRNISDYSAFVYYSNIRVVELSPFIPWTNQPVAGLIVTQGATFTLQSGAMYASNPLTNIWYLARTNGTSTPLTNLNNGTLQVAIATNTFSDTHGIVTLTVNDIQSGTNYMCTWSDQAGSITSWRSIVEVVRVPNKTVAPGIDASLAVAATGNQPPSAYQWYFNGSPLANSTKYAGVTTATLWITNTSPADAGVYSNTVANAFGTAVPAGTLAVTTVAITPTAQTVMWGQNASFTASSADPATSWTWRKGSTKLFNSAKYGSSTNTVTLTILGATTADQAANYNCQLGYSDGSVITSANASLNVTVPAPVLGGISLGGGNTLMAFTTTNAYDTTNAFAVWRSPKVEGPYTNATSGALFSTNAVTGTFELTIPVTSDPAMFYKLQHVQ